MEYLQYNSNAELNFNAAPKRKRNYACDGLDGNPVRQRSQANARERDRTHRCKMTLSSVNSAFTTLRTLIPTEPKDRKLSKIETLRLASSYISHLGTQLMAGRIDQPCLRIPKQMLENNEPPSATNRHQVCTFCIAHKKAPKNQNFDDYVCSLENQTYYDQNLIDASTNLSNANTDLYF